MTCRLVLCHLHGYRPVRGVRRGIWCCVVEKNPPNNFFQRGQFPDADNWLLAEWSHRPLVRLGLDFPGGQL